MDSTTHAPQQLGHRPVLDGLRAPAAMLVIAIHVGLLTAGYVGVDVFLALSGFLITALLFEEWERTGRISVRRFYRRRAQRLLPSLVLLLAVFFLVMILLHPFALKWPLAKLLGSTLLFVNNWVCALLPAHGAVLGPLSPTWTLAQEVQFYLLWPPILWALLRLQVRPRMILALLAGAIVALLASDVLVQHLYPSYNPYTSPFDRAAEMLLGAATAIVWRERLVPSALRRPITGWLLLGGLAFLVGVGEPSDPVWYLTAAGLGAMLVVNLLSLPDATARRGRSLLSAAPRALSRVLGSRPLVYTGKISYEIYLFHVPLYYLLWTYVPVSSPLLYWTIVFVLSFAAAAGSVKLVRFVIARWPAVEAFRIATYRRLAPSLRSP